MQLENGLLVPVQVPLVEMAVAQSMPAVSTNKASPPPVLRIMCQ